MIAALLPLVLAGQVAAAPVTLRADAPAITQIEARAMTPAALGDALLAVGHPPIVERIMLPEGMAPPPPPGTPPWIDVRLVAAAEEDRASGFCVKRSWTVRDSDTAPRAILEQRHYRLPSSGGRGDRCDAPVHAFFTVAANARPRAFAVVHLLASAIHKARRVDAVLSVDDQLGRQLRDYERTQLFRRFPPTRVITDARAALAGLAPDVIFAIDPADYRDKLLTQADRTAADGTRREVWHVRMGGEWWVEMALDGDRIAVIRLRRAIPPPF